MEPALRIRPEQPADVDQVRNVVAAAFGGPRVPGLVDGLRASVAWLDLSFVAELDDALVGHVCYTRGWVDAPERVVDVLVLSPLSVHPDHQRRGIGTALVEQSLARLARSSECLVFLEGSPSYYPRLGFVPGSSLGFSSPSVRIPDPAFQVFPLPGYERSGAAVTGALVYPDVFWRHDCVGLRD